MPTPAPTLFVGSKELESVMHFLPESHWLKMNDKATGQTYWYNSKTKKTSWRSPFSRVDSQQEKDKSPKQQKADSAASINDKVREATLIQEQIMDHTYTSNSVGGSAQDSTGHYDPFLKLEKEASASAKAAALETPIGWKRMPEAQLRAYHDGDIGLPQPASPSPLLTAAPSTTSMPSKAPTGLPSSAPTTGTTTATQELGNIKMKLQNFVTNFHKDADDNFITKVAAVVAKNDGEKSLPPAPPTTKQLPAPAPEVDDDLEREYKQETTKEDIATFRELPPIAALEQHT
jgi:hypothetical protein